MYYCACLIFILRKKGEKNGETVMYHFRIKDIIHEGGM